MENLELIQKVLILGGYGLLCCTVAYFTARHIADLAADRYSRDKEIVARLKEVIEEHKENGLAVWWTGGRKDLAEEILKKI